MFWFYIQFYLSPASCWQEKHQSNISAVLGSSLAPFLSGGHTGRGEKYMKETIGRPYGVTLLTKKGLEGLGEEDGGADLWHEEQLGNPWAARSN